MNAYEIYMDYLFAKASTKGIPLSGTFELTSRCNLDCKMCYIHKRENDGNVIEQELSSDFWIGLAHQCKSAGMLHLLLTGGEPLLRRDFKEIYTQCRKMGLLVSVNSNATLFDEEIFEMFSQFPPARANISLYGASSATYDSLCGKAQAYEKTIGVINRLNKSGINLKINSSMTSLNRHDMLDIYNFAKNNDIPIQTATYMYPPARACEIGCYDCFRLSPEESAELQVCYDQHRIPKEDLIHRWKSQLNGIHVSDKEKRCQEVAMERINCRAGQSTFWVTWDGMLRPCGMMTTPSTNLLKMDFRNAWSEIMKAREEIFTPEKCVQCEIREACDQCAAICQAETGSFSGVPEYMCKRTEAYLRIVSDLLQKV